jgi:hypothetical protein
VHSAVDTYSRVPYSEVLGDEQGATAAAFWSRATAFFASLGIVVERVLTDNGPCYRGRLFNQTSAASPTPTRAVIDHRPTERSSGSTARS